MWSKSLMVAGVALAAGTLALMASAARQASPDGALSNPNGEPARQVRVVVVDQERGAGDPIDQQEEQLKAQTEELKAQQEQLKKQAKELQIQHEAMKKQIYVITGRPKLGIVLRTERDPSSDASGAYVEAVTPGGPADEAGVRAGDVITKINGESLTGKYAGADEDESEPALKLMDAIGKLKAGDKVTLNYLRGKEARTASVTLRHIESRDYTYRLHVTEPPEPPEPPEMPDMSDMDIEVPDFSNWSFMGHGLGWLDMEMVPMNADLGEYFGTSEGILVVHAPADSPLKIKAGDVILKVGDRTPKSPSQVMRILRSYEPGENVNMEVLRKRSRATLTFKVPERSKAEWHEHGKHSVAVPAQPSPAPSAASPEAPATPAAPVAPMPPPSKT